MSTTVLCLRSKLLPIFTLKDFDTGIVMSSMYEHYITSDAYCIIAYFLFVFSSLSTGDDELRFSFQFDFW